MLDLIKIAKQMQGLSQHLSLEAAANKQKLEVAQKLFEEAGAKQENLLELQEQWRDRLIFNPPIPVEPLDSCFDIPVPPKAHTVIATDGSQISPSHHEIAYCYLINIGRVVLHYGQGRHPMLDSIPEVFYRAEDLYVSQQWKISTEEWMGYRRTISEAVVLAELCTDWAKSQEFNPNYLHQQLSKVPTLAMVDGSLLHWFLEDLPHDAIAHIIPPILDAWEQLRSVGIPLLGYLSASRSAESLSFLRPQACTYPTPNCASYCANSNAEDKKPCQVFHPLRDIIFWGSRLQPGQRSPLWKSTNRILSYYSDRHQIYFCYLHVGLEIARIEVPAWVAEDSALLDLSLSLVLAQIQKGYGYPIVLAEAHNHAVVKGGDRARFFALLEQQMIKAGLKNVGTSYKEARKRGSIA